jgi:hypothetical protein
MKLSIISILLLGLFATSSEKEVAEEPDTLTKVRLIGDLNTQMTLLSLEFIDDPSTGKEYFLRGLARYRLALRPDLFIEYPDLGKESRYESELMLAQKDFEKALSLDSSLQDARAYINHIEAYTDQISQEDYADQLVDFILEAKKKGARRVPDYISDDDWNMATFDYKSRK